TLAASFEMRPLHPATLRRSRSVESTLRAAPLFDALAAPSFYPAGCVDVVTIGGHITVVVYEKTVTRPMIGAGGRVVVRERKLAIARREITVGQREVPLSALLTRCAFSTEKKESDASTHVASVHALVDLSPEQLVSLGEAHLLRRLPGSSLR